MTSKIYLNAKDAARVCGLASQWFTTELDVDACPVHGGYGSADQREILPHERTRILDSWYLLKLHAEFFKLLGQQHHQSMTQELCAISPVQAYALWSMVVFMCVEMDLNAREVRISLPTFLARIVIVPSFIRLSSPFQETLHA